MRFAWLIVALLFAAACSDDVVDSSGPPPPNLAHDTIEIHTPPSPGGFLPGSWKIVPSGWSGSDRYWLTQQGLRGYLGILYYTDLRVDGSRVWFEAYEIGKASEKIFYNGTMSDSTITGWGVRQLWTSDQGFLDEWHYAPVDFTRE